MAVFNFIKGLHYIKTVRKEVNIIVVISFLIWVVKVLYLNEISTPYAYFSKIGIIIESLCASIVASYIFYLFVIHVKEENDKEIINPYIQQKIKSVINDCKIQLELLSEATSVSLQIETLTEDEIKKAFEMVSLNDNLPIPPYYEFSIGLTSLTWLQFMNSRRICTSNTISKILTHAIHLDAKLIKCLVDIDDCPHFTKAIDCLSQSNQKIDGSVYSSLGQFMFFKYCSLVKELQAFEVSK